MRNLNTPSFVGLLLVLAGCTAPDLEGLGDPGAVPELDCDPGSGGTRQVFAGAVVSGGTTTEVEAFQNAFATSHFVIRDDCAFVVRPVEELGSWSRTYAGYSDQEPLQAALEPLLGTANDRRDGLHASALTLEDEQGTFRVEGTQALFLPAATALAALGTIATPSILEVALIRTDAPHEVIPWPFQELAPSTAPQQVPAAEIPATLALWPARSTEAPHVRLDGQLYTLALRETVDLLAL